VANITCVNKFNEFTEYRNTISFKDWKRFSTGFGLHEKKLVVASVPAALSLLIQLSYNLVVVTLSLSSENCLYVTEDPPASPGLRADGLARRSGSESEDKLVESAVCLDIKAASTGLVDELVLFAGFTDGLTTSCFCCCAGNKGFVDEPEGGLERAWFTSAKRRAGSGGLAEDSDLVCTVTLDEQSWNIDWGLEGCILSVTLAGVCLRSGPGKD
jgi:hypothetical protein